MTKRKSLKSNSGPVKKYQNGDPVYDTDDREMLQQYFSNQLIPHFEQTYGAAEAVTKALEWLQGKYPDAYKALVKPKSIDVNDATGRIPGILANLPLSAISAPSAFFAETLDDQPGINLERALGMGSEPQLSIGNSLGIQSPILSLGVDLAFDPLNLATGAGIIKAAKPGLKLANRFRKAAYPIIDKGPKTSKETLDWMKNWYNHPSFKDKFNSVDNRFDHDTFIRHVNNVLDNPPIKNYFDLLKDEGLATYLKKSMYTGGLSTGDNVYLNRTSKLTSPFYPLRNFESVRGHELSHVLDDNGWFISVPYQKELLKPLGLSLTDYVNLQSNKSLRTIGKRYYSDPTEIRARMTQARQYFNLTPEDEFTESMYNRLKKKNSFFGLSNFIKDKKGFVDLMNKSWATVPAGYAGYAALNSEGDGGPGLSMNTARQALSYQQGGFPPPKQMSSDNTRVNVVLPNINGLPNDLIPTEDGQGYYSPSALNEETRKRGWGPIVNEKGEAVDWIMASGTILPESGPIELLIDLPKSLGKKVIQKGAKALNSIRFKPNPQAIITPAGFKNRVSSGYPQLGSFKGIGHLSEEGYTYRTLGLGEIEAIRNTKGVFPKPGKAKGGNTNVKYWTKGNNKNWYADNPNQQVIRVKNDRLFNDKVVDAKDVEIFNHETQKFEPILTMKKGGYSVNYQDGGFIPSSPLGQWKYPEQTVNVPSNNITMKGINHPNLGIGDNGIMKMMFPGKNYNFPGAKSVTEIPILKKGGYGSDPKAEGKSKDVDYDSLIEYIKEVEGFRSEPYWDVKQWTVGYGTKAQGKNDKVDEKEALKRLKEDLKMRKKYVKEYSEKHGYKWTPTQIDALTSFVYNLGVESLDQLTDNGTRDETTIAKKILEYNNVRNSRGRLQRSEGLTKRRKFESDLFSGLGGDILDFFHGSPMAHVEVVGEGTKMDSLPTIQPSVQSLNPALLGLPKKFQDGDFAQMPQDNTVVNRPMIMGEDPENVLPINEQRQTSIDQAINMATAPFRYGFPMIPINIPGVMNAVKPALQRYAYENLPFTELGSGEFFPDSRLWYPSPPGVNFAYDEDEPKDWSKSALMKEIFTLVKNNDKKNLQWIDDIAKDEDYKEWTEYKPSADLYAMYLNQDQPFGTIRKSGFKPSDSKDPNAQYYAMSEDIEKNIYSDTVREFEKLNENKFEFETKNGFYKIPMTSNALGQFTAWYNPDTGEVRYYDKFDLDRIPFADDVIGKPFEIYNRINFRGKLKQSNKPSGGGAKYWEEIKAKDPQKFAEYQEVMKKFAKLDSLQAEIDSLDTLLQTKKKGGYAKKKNKKK